MLRYEAVIYQGRTMPGISEELAVTLSNIQTNLLSPNFEFQLQGICDALKYGADGFDLIVDALRDGSLNFNGFIASGLNKIMRQTVETHDFGWYTPSKTQTEDPNDTLRIACNKLLKILQKTYNCDWFIGGDWNTICFESHQMKQPKLSKKLISLSQLLSAEKLRRKIILDHGHNYSYSSELYARKIFERTIERKLKNRILNQGIQRSILPIFEELLDSRCATRPQAT